jgi:hypothetical protein
VALRSWFLANVKDGETQLMVGAKDALVALGDSYQICGGEPALISRSSTIDSNGGCPDILTSVNASCTCLSGYDESAASWQFVVSEKTDDDEAFPLALTSSDVLEVTTIRSFWVSSELHTL